MLMLAFPQKSKLSLPLPKKTMERQCGFCLPRPRALHFLVFKAAQKLIAAYLVSILPLLAFWPDALLAQEAATSTEAAVAETALADAPAAEITEIPAVEPLVAEQIIPAIIDLPADNLPPATTTENVFPEVGILNNEIATTTIAAVTAISESEFAASSTEAQPAALATTTTETGLATTTQTIIATTSQEAAPLPVLPQILAQWQMTTAGLDDATTTGAQFEPRGLYGASKEIGLCAAVLAGNSPITKINTQIFYPQNAAFGPTDYLGRVGCGQVLNQSLVMEKLSPEAGFDLLCEKIQKNNANLPVFSGSDFVSLCSADGLLIKQTAAVYCAPAKLANDDISGDYQTSIVAYGAGGQSQTSTGQFAYLARPVLQIDFDNLDYGKVRENTEAVIAGDEIWGAENLTRATARNAGNTRLKIVVWQDDMGVGQTNGTYNIRYRARLGEGNPWQDYLPFETATLVNILDLSSDQPVDFSTIVAKFLNESDKKDYQGKMTINAVLAPHYQCANVFPLPISPESQILPLENQAAPAESQNAGNDLFIKPENTDNNLVIDAPI